jgi:regulatory protein
MEQEAAKVLDRMRALCSRREYCRKDIMKKVLPAVDGDVTVAGGIIDMLVKEKYIDELRYASAFARDKSSIAGWGAVKIRYMLSAKGIPEGLVAQALEEIDGEKAVSRLDKLMENKFRSLKEDPQCRLKMLRFGLGRGYGYDEVSSVVDRLMKR